MVFGHYSIPIHTIAPNQIPPQLNPGPGLKYQLLIRVAHVMWIPLFPFEKTWAISTGSEKYKVNRELSHRLDSQFGRKATPWYGFAGPLLLVGGIILFSITDYFEGRARKERYAANLVTQLSEKRDKINNPQTNDYYLLATRDANNRSKQTTLKVESTTADSIKFAVPATSRTVNWGSVGTKVGYFKNENAFIVPATVAKADLLRIVDEEEAQPNAYAYSSISNLLDGAKLKIRGIDRVEEENVVINYEDELAEDEVKEAFLTYMNSQHNIDSSLLLIDSASIAYFDNILNLAKSEDSKKAKEFVYNAPYPDITYKFMMYTLYSYIPTTAKSPNESAEAEMKDYGFYLKLLDLGLWLIDFNKAVLGKTTINKVSFSSSDKANIFLSAPSNSLTRSTKIHFQVEMNKENGAWKVNIPSSLSYTQKQINIGISYRGGKEYREMVVDEIKQLESSTEVAQEWIY
jgi:hypothetical protein